MPKKTIRPKNISDLDLIWAIRDIPKHILCIKLKCVLYTFVSLIGNSKNEWYYKSIPSLANLMGYNDRRLPALLNQLEDLGFIFINRPASYKKGNTNEYKLNYNLILSTADDFREQSLG